MKISLNWLKDYVDYGGSAAEFAELLTRAGLEVGSVVTRGAEIPNVVVAQIVESNPHPNADRLSVCRVDDGSGEPRQVVCGAKNYKVGDKVPLALPGAVLPGEFKIKIGKLRGVESEGMLCSAKELNLAEDAEGLLILPADAEIGTPISALFPSDTILELEITPNRPDWLSHVGIAREVRAFTGSEVREPRVSAPISEIDDDIARIEDAAACPFYTLRRIRSVKVGPSPEWLRTRLEAVGLRPINNVVDVTNYVMYEFGQPLHAFNAAKLDGGIVVRRGRGGEEFHALDGNIHALNPDHLVIADQSKPVAIAGVMGGEESGVAESTVEVWIESALFQPSLIRRMSRALGLASDSSYRFERGVDPDGVLKASARAAELIVDVAGGEADAMIFTAGDPGPSRRELSLRHDRCRALLGMDLSDSRIVEALERVGLEKVESENGASAWRSPRFRADLRREADLVEEVIRIVGIESVAGRVCGTPAASSPADARYDFAQGLRARLDGLGFSEARTGALIARKAADAFGAGVIELKNPLGEEQAVMRPSMLPGLLAAVRRNLNHGAETVRLFEIGRVFAQGGSEETLKLALVACGAGCAATWRTGERREIDFFDLKGAVEALSPTLSFRPVESAVFPLALELTCGDAVVGVMGQLAPARAREIDARGPVLAAEIALDPLLEAARFGHAYEPLPKFQSVVRDVAAVVDGAVRWETIEQCLSTAGEPLLVAVRPFDVFADPTGERLPAGRKSVAFSLTLRAADRTLTAEEINAACDRLKQRLRAEIPAELRE
jgi:phenylalanyl-tRNA synthetase beta chain